MKPVGVFYATREGQAQRVADQVAAGLRQRGIDAAVTDVRETKTVADLGNYAAIVLAASVHAGRHEREMVEFVKTHREDLQAMPNAFISVTLSEAGAERRDVTAEVHERFVADVRGMIDRFVADTGWQPEHVVPVAGALRYSQYSFVLRFIMKRIARKAGAATDSSHDYEYTDWSALDDFVGLFAEEVRTRVASD